MIPFKTNRAAALVIGLGLVCAAGAADKPSLRDTDLAAFVNGRVEAWEPRPEERRFDAIGWARDIREAEDLAQKHGRPVFLFTHDGRMNISRC